jgi:hypothetical protein
MNMIATVGVAALITGEITSKTVGFTINALSNTLSYMTTISEDEIIRRYRDELETIDVEFKLKIIQEWLNNMKDKENKQRENGNNNKTDNISQGVQAIQGIQELYKSIADVCEFLTKHLELIEAKIKQHKSKWFHTWRSLDLFEEINIVKRKALILNERIILIMMISSEKK